MNFKRFLFAPDGNLVIGSAHMSHPRRRLFSGRQHGQPGSARTSPPTQVASVLGGPERAAAPPKGDPPAF